MIRFVKVISIVIIINLVLVGCNTKYKKNKIDHFNLGITIEECKKQLEDYKFKIDENNTIRIENYMNLNGKQASLTLIFSNNLKIDNTMQNLDEDRLILYAFSVENVDYNYNKKIIEDYIKLYGEPSKNNFFDKDAKDKEDGRSAIWKLDDYDIGIYDYTGKNAKSFINVSFKLNDKIREKFKKYIR